MKKVVSIHVKLGDEELFNKLINDISEETKLKIEDYKELISIPGHKPLWKSRVFIKFDDGTEDKIYTMDSNYYYDLFFPKKKEESSKIKEVDEIFSSYIFNKEFEEKIKNNIISVKDKFKSLEVSKVYDSDKEDMKICRGVIINLVDDTKIIMNDFVL